MRLNSWSRIWLALIGGALVTAGGVGAAFDWSGVGLTALIVAGVFMLIGAVIGALPKGSFKDGTIEFPDVDKHPRVEALEAALVKVEDALKKQHDETRIYNNLLLDYILAHEPSPDDGNSAHERLSELERAAGELSNEVSYRYFTGEGYDDGVGVDELEKWRDNAERMFAHEERRQVARKRFNLPIDDKPGSE